MKNSKLNFSEYMQTISRSKSFGKFVLLVISFLVSEVCSTKTSFAMNATSEISVLKALEYVQTVYEIQF